MRKDLYLRTSINISCPTAEGNRLSFLVHPHTWGYRAQVLWAARWFTAVLTGGMIAPVSPLDPQSRAEENLENMIGRHSHCAPGGRKHGCNTQRQRDAMGAWDPASSLDAGRIATALT